MSNLNASMQVKHKRGTAAAWEASGTYIPLDGELIIYKATADEPAQIKVGDGKTAVRNLPFSASMSVLKEWTEEVNSSVVDIQSKVDTNTADLQLLTKQQTDSSVSIALLQQTTNVQEAQLTSLTEHVDDELNKTSAQIQQVANENKAEINSLTEHVDAEFNSTSTQIQQLSDDTQASITSLANKQTEFDGKLTTVSSQIEQVATDNGATLALTTKIVDSEGNIKAAEIINAVNADGSSTTIKADKINLSGKVTIGDLSDNTKSNVISSSQILYGLSDSEEIEPTEWVDQSEWNTGDYVWTVGKYTWQKTIITKLDETVVETAVCIQGANGANGTSGRGVSTIVNYYMASSRSEGVLAGDAGEVQTEKWTTTVQTTDSTKPYLWNYEVTLYTDEDSVATDPAIIGTYSEDGRGISSVEEFYCISSNTTCATPTEETLNSATNYTAPAVADIWYKTSPPTDSTNKYLWNCERIKYTDGTHDIFAPAIIGTHGENGTDGKDGTDGTNGSDGTSVTAVITRYFISNSNTDKPSNEATGWLTDFDTVLNTFFNYKKTDPNTTYYIWSQEQITYSNNTSTYTTPTVKSANSVVATWCKDNDDLKIDGANIAANTITALQIDAGTITADKIKAGELVVGENVTMGDNATIKWTSVTGTDNIASKGDVSTAKDAAISAASTDATNKANQAQSNAVSTIESKGYQTSAQVTQITRTTITTENLTATNLHVAAANIDGTLTADQIATDAIKSKNYKSTNGASGTFLNLADGSISSKNFNIDTNGNVAVTGVINANAGGTIGGWEITTSSLEKTNGNNTVSIRCPSWSSHYYEFILEGTLNGETSQATITTEDTSAVNITATFNFVNTSGDSLADVTASYTINKTNGIVSSITYINHETNYYEEGYDDDFSSQWVNTLDYLKYRNAKKVFEVTRDNTSYCSIDELGTLDAKNAKISGVINTTEGGNIGGWTVVNNSSDSRGMLQNTEGSYTFTLAPHRLNSTGNVIEIRDTTNSINKFYVNGTGFLYCDQIRATGSLMAMNKFALGLSADGEYDSSIYTLEASKNTTTGDYDRLTSKGFVVHTSGVGCSCLNDESSDLHVIDFYKPGKNTGSSAWIQWNGQDSNTLQFTLASGITGTFGGAGSWDLAASTSATSTDSDRNLKHEITVLPAAYSTLFDNLKPVIYKYKNGTSNRYHTGYIAQDVEEAMTKAGLTRQDFAGLCIEDEGLETERWRLRYEEFVSLNTFEIQKLKARITELEKKIEELTK